ncbi:MAG: hypothetical protein R3Y54_03955 [Eubacteriales bacterium]
MGFFSELFSRKEKSVPSENLEKINTLEKTNPDFDALRDFCSIILMNKHQDVIKQCVKTMENDNESIADILLILSGYDDVGCVLRDAALIDNDSYMISSDCGAPDLRSFFDYVDSLKKGRNLDFNYDEEKFSKDRAMDKWMAELVPQLTDLHILVFDGASDIYHYIIVNKETGDKAKVLFEKMAQHITSYKYTADYINENFAD